MKYQNYTSNNAAGDNFLLGIIDIDKRRHTSRNLFNEFIEHNNFSAWHIHNGWIMNGYQRGDILHHEDIRVVWIDSQAGYSHTYRCPEIGEKMIIIKDSPDIKYLNPFKIYCYEVVEKPRTGYSSDEIKLKRIDIKEVVFNKTENRYQFYIKKRWNIFSLFTRPLC